MVTSSHYAHDDSMDDVLKFEDFWFIDNEAVNNSQDIIHSHNQPHTAMHKISITI